MIGKILVFRTFWYPDNGPGTMRVEHFLRALIARGHDVTYLALKSPRSEDQPDPLQECRTILVPHSVRPGGLKARIEARVVRGLPHADFYGSAVWAVERKAVELLRGGSFDLLVTTYLPMDSLRLAARLHSRFAVPWIADLRDLPDQFQGSRDRLLTRMKVGFVKRSCRTAAHLTTTTHPLRIALKERYGLGGRATTIYNGYDEDLVGQIYTYYKATFEIGFFGTVYGPRSLDVLFGGLRLLHEQGFELNGVRVRLIGRMLVERFMPPADSPIGPLIRYEGVLSHAAAVRTMSDCAVLVNLGHPDSGVTLALKLFDYAATARHVLSIPRDGGVQDDFIERSGIGFAADTPEEVAAFLAPLINEWRGSGEVKGPKTHWNYVRQFSRARQSELFADIVDVELVRLNARGAAERDRTKGSCGATSGNAESS